MSQGYFSGHGGEALHQQCGEAQHGELPSFLRAHGDGSCKLGRLERQDMVQQWRWKADLIEQVAGQLVERRGLDDEDIDARRGSLFQEIIHSRQELEREDAHQ